MLRHSDNNSKMFSNVLSITLDQGDLYETRIRYTTKIL
jgi:hypothetical protein